MKVEVRSEWDLISVFQKTVLYRNNLRNAESR